MDVARWWARSPPSQHVKQRIFPFHQRERVRQRGPRGLEHLQPPSQGLWKHPSREEGHLIDASPGRGGRVTVRNHHCVGPVAGDGLPLPVRRVSCTGMRGETESMVQSPRRVGARRVPSREAPTPGATQAVGAVTQSPKSAPVARCLRWSRRAQRAQPWTEPLLVSVWLREEGGIVRSPPRLTVRAEYLGWGFLSFPPG